MSGPAVLGRRDFHLQSDRRRHAGHFRPADGRRRATSRWKTFLTASALAPSTRPSPNFDIDPTVTGSIASTGIDTPGVGRVVVTPAKAEVAATPDEARINRAEKTGRIVSVAPAAPPRDFSAGSVLERQSRLTQPAFDHESLMAFARPKIGGKEIQIATAFHKHSKPADDPQVPVMLASLVTNTKADVAGDRLCAGRARFRPPVPLSQPAEGT
jgi:hypothetical protein